jgi:hypothetical protein
MSNTVLVLLTIASGIFTLAGTATVAFNYFRAADLARAMKEQMDVEAERQTALGNLVALCGRRIGRLISKS